MYSWREVYEMSAALLEPRAKEAPAEADGDAAGGGGNDEVATYRVASMLPVIVWDAESRQRRVVPMRWGFPHPQDWRRPQPIHARAETVDSREPFRTPFHAGQRGIVLFRTFNEGKEIAKPSGKSATEQWTIDPRDGRPRGFAFVWRRFEIAGLPQPLLACCMVTVAASALVRTIMEGVEDPRMPAILEDAAWPAWLGESGAPAPEAKALLKTMEGVNWTIAPEPKKPRPPRKP